MSLTDTSDQEEALNRHLTSYQSDHIAWEGAGYTPTPGTTYLEPLCFPGRSSQATLGPNGGQNYHVGLYVVNVKASAGDGWKTQQVKADAIANHFKRGTILTYNGVKVRIQRAKAGARFPEGDRVVVPVDIEWFAFIDN